MYVEKTISLADILVTLLSNSCMRDKDKVNTRIPFCTFPSDATNNTETHQSIENSNWPIATQHILHRHKTKNEC